MENPGTVQRGCRPVMSACAADKLADAEVFDSRTRGVVQNVFDDLGGEALDVMKRKPSTPVWRPTK